MPAGTVVASGVLVSPGGQQGIPGPNAVSTDPGNQATFGSDARIYVPISVPSGSVVDYAGATAPTGWLLCDGTSYLRATYPNLFASIGTTFGSVDGTHFNVPDLRSRFVLGAGQGSGLTNRVLAATSGEETHLLTAAELASHTHTASSTQGNHTHTATDSGHAHGHDYVNQSLASGGLGIPTPAQANTGTSLSTRTGTAVITVSTVSAGAITTTVNATAAGGAHNTMPPFMALNKIIKT
jgi:microcystin-dependent protein